MNSSWLLQSLLSVASSANVPWLRNFAKWIPRGVPRSLFLPFPDRHYNWSDSGGNDSLWLGFGSRCVYSNAVLQPVTDFCFSSRGELAVPSLQAPCSAPLFSLFVRCRIRALPTILFHFLRKTKKDKRRSVHGEQISSYSKNTNREYEHLDVSLSISATTVVTFKASSPQDIKMEHEQRPCENTNTVLISAVFKSHYRSQTNPLMTFRVMPLYISNNPSMQNGIKPEKRQNDKGNLIFTRRGWWVLSLHYHRKPSPSWSSVYRKKKNIWRACQ